MPESIAPVQRESPAPAETSPSGPRRAGATRWLVVAAAALLVIGPLLGGGLHQERANWQIAKGMELWLDGDLAAALAELDAAAQTAPEYARVYALRAQWRTEAKDYAGALEDARRLRKLAPSDPQGFHFQTEALVSLGRAKEAVKVWEEYAALEKTRLGAARASTLNGAAYYRALANVELETALAEVNQALGLLGPDPALIDTRGFVYFRQQHYAAALDDLNASVAAVERELEKLRTQEKTYVQLSVKDPRVAQWETKQLTRNVAVIRYHRAVIHAALGHDEDAQRDLRRVRELGFEPGPKLF